jgi:hypothetical protein
MRNRLIIAAALLGAGMLMLTGTLRMVRADHDNDEKHLFVWAGDQARIKPDFLAVIDFDEKSRDYGSVIATVPLPGPGATGNEPHHLGLSADGRVLGAGGLLSVLKGQKEIFFFDVTDPNRPKFLTSADPPLSAITDEFHALPEGGFLVTMMGGAKPKVLRVLDLGPGPDPIICVSLPTNSAWSSPTTSSTRIRLEKSMPKETTKCTSCACTAAI